jgi:hypothetical protein
VWEKESSPFGQSLSKASLGMACWFDRITMNLQFPTLSTAPIRMIVD